MRDIHPYSVKVLVTLAHC